jgi:hypothetical protein
LGMRDNSTALVGLKMIWKGAIGGAGWLVERTGTSRFIEIEPS